MGGNTQKWLLMNKTVQLSKGSCWVWSKMYKIIIFLKIFFEDNFYRAAPVPRCLGLYDGQHVSDFLEQELSLWCNTGVSMGLIHQGRVVAAGFNLYINRSMVDEKIRLSSDSNIFNVTPLWSPQLQPWLYPCQGLAQRCSRNIPGNTRSLTGIRNLEKIPISASLSLW